MDALAEYRSETSRRARERIVELLREHALSIGEVTLASGRIAQYYVDAKRAILLPEAFMALGLLVAEQARAFGASAVGGVTISADPGGLRRARRARAPRESSSCARTAQGSRPAALDRGARAR